MRPAPARASVARVSSVLAGVAWILATFLPWAQRGLLSSSSLVEAASFVRRGVIDVVPSGAAVLLLAPTAAGVVLVGLGGMSGPKVGVARAVAGWTGCALSLLLVAQLTGFEPGRWGSGAVVAAVGSASFLIGQAVGIWGKWPRHGPGAH